MDQAKKYMNEKNYEEANKIFAEIAPSNPSAMLQLALNFFRGYGVKQDPDYAHTLSKISLDMYPSLDRIEVVCELHLSDLNRYRFEHDEESTQEFYKETLNYLNFAEMYGSQSGLIYFSLGRFYESGTGTEVDIQKAMSYYQKTLNYNSSSLDALFNLARLQLNSEEFLNEGVKNILLCSQFKLAHVYIGRIYYEGKLVNKNYSSAYEFFSKSAKKGVLESQFYLAEMLENGIPDVCEKNLDKAVNLYFGVAAALADCRDDFVIESLPPKATSPEFCVPIGKRAMDKLRKYRPELIDMVDKMKMLAKSEKCTCSFTDQNFNPQRCIDCFNFPGFIDDSCICFHCAKYCMPKNIQICDSGFSHCYCDCGCAYKK